jgi:hypothetical protein
MEAVVGRFKARKKRRPDQFSIFLLTPRNLPGCNLPRNPANYAFAGSVCHTMIDVVRAHRANPASR